MQITLMASKRMKTILLITVLLISHNEDVRAARILAVYPTPSISHQVAFRPLTNELVRRGHEVTVITPDPAYVPGKAPTNLTEINVHDLSYKIWKEVLHIKFSGKLDDVYTQMGTMFRGISEVFYSQIATKEIQDIINKKNGEYDLLLLEACAKPTLVFSHFFKVPVIQISSMGSQKYNSRTVGAVTHPLLYPTHFHQRVYNLTYLEKLQQLYGHWSMENQIDQIEQDDSKRLKSIFGSDVPSLHELSNNVQMLFLNVNPIWVDNQPVPTNVVYMGGIHMTPPKQLPQDLQLYLDSSKNGVIYFSLGTNIVPSLLPPESINIFKRVFSQLPYDVIWKWDKDVLPGKSENIKIFKWVPQSDLIRHKNVKLFITQGGLQSTDEAIRAGVPLIGIPTLGDQWYNVEKYVHHKIGIRLDMPSMNEKELKHAIEKVIGDKSYRENIQRLRTLMEDQPQSPLERTVWWTEYVLRHGGANHLRATGANISWTEYLELELVLIVVITLFGTLSVLSLSVYVLWKFLSNYFNINSHNKIKKP